MADKVCERCGALYSSMKSTTCPECFAKLLTVDRETFEELLAARAEVETSEQFKAAKSEDDEVFRHQSFKACMVTIGIAFFTLAAAAAMFIGLMREKRRLHPVTTPTATFFSDQTGIALPGVVGPPVTATIATVLPRNLGQFQRVEYDSDTLLPGTVMPVYHAIYASESGAGRVAMAAIPESSNQQQLELFANSFNLTSSLGVAKESVLIVDTRHWRFALIGDYGTAAFGSTAKLKSALEKSLKRP